MRFVIPANRVVERSTRDAAVVARDASSREIKVERILECVPRNSRGENAREIQTVQRKLRGSREKVLRHSGRLFKR